MSACDRSGIFPSLQMGLRSLRFRFSEDSHRFVYGFDDMVFVNGFEEFEI